MNLSQTIGNIQINQVALIETEKNILELKNTKSDLEEKITKLSFDVQRVVYFSSDYKNEKQREIAMIDLLADNSEIFVLQHELKGISYQLELINITKMKFKADYDYYKNCLRVAEIELALVKSGV